MSLGTLRVAAPVIGCIKLNVRNQEGPCISMSEKKNLEKETL